MGAHHIGLIIEAAEGRQRSIYWHKFVDWLSKMVHITCYPTVEALDARTCKALQRLDPAVACMPDSVMSDRGHPQFNNLCWKEVDNVKSMRRKLFSAFRPQTYGRIENKPHSGGNIVGVCATRSDRLG